MNITAIVPVWNGQELLRRLLDSLEQQTLLPTELLVVDNGSTDGAPDLARERGARVIEMGHNAGFAPAVNRAIKEATGDRIAVLNSDVVLAPDYLERLAASDAWFATGKILSESSPQTIDGTFDLVCRGGTAWRAGNGKLDGLFWDMPRTIWSAPWTAALFRTEIFRRAGLLEESFESYLEDVDFGLRCARAGLDGEYIPGAVAWHRGSATLGHWHPQTVRRIARNQLWLIARHYSAGAIFGSLLHLGAAQALWFLLAMRHGVGLAWLHGRIQGWIGFRKARAVTFDPRLVERLRENDRLIAKLQSSAGFDTYWWLYLMLTGG